MIVFGRRSKTRYSIYLLMLKLCLEEGGTGLLLAAYSMTLVWGKFTLVSTQQPIAGAIPVRRMLKAPPTTYPDTVRWMWWVVTFIKRNSFLCEPVSFSSYLFEHLVPRSGYVHEWHIST